MSKQQTAVTITLDDELVQALGGPEAIAKIIEGDCTVQSAIGALWDVPGHFQPTDEYWEVHWAAREKENETAEVGEGPAE